MALSVVREAKRRRWAVVAVVTAALLVVPAVVEALRPAGPAVDPARLRDLVLRSDYQPYQGYARSTGALALPELPNLADVSALFTTTTNTHVWYAAPDRYRVAVLTTAGSTTSTGCREPNTPGTTAPTPSPSSPVTRSSGFRARATWYRPSWRAGFSGRPHAIR